MFRITLREVLFSISILLVCIAGMLAGHFAIINHYVGINERYQMAREIETAEMFNYYHNANIGDAFTYTELHFLDSVSSEELGTNSFSYIHKMVEKYTQHTRIETYTDSDGKSHTRTKTYWSWDHYYDEYKASTKVSFNGIEISNSILNTSSAHYKVNTNNINGSIDGQSINHKDQLWVYTNYMGIIGPRLRYQYYAGDLDLKGASFISLTEDTVKPAEGNKIVFYNNSSVAAVKSTTLKSPTTGIVLLWVFGGIATLMLIGIFWALENYWLND